VWKKLFKTYCLNLITGTENAIKLPDHKLQNAFCIMTVNKLKQIYNSNSNMKATHKRHLHNKIKHKITTGNAMLAQKDKGRTTVIIYKHDYDEKVHAFLTKNDINPTPKNPLNKDCKLIWDTLQQCNLIFSKNQIRKLTPKNPTPPRLNACLKIHKPNNPIWPIVNNKNAPTYKIAKKLNDILKQHLQLENQYHTLYSENWAHNISALKINNNHKMITYDIKDLYVNIPIEETLTITKQQLLKNNDKNKTKQIITILQTILEQNYFEFQGTIYHPNKGIEMGSPISGTTAKTFLRHIEKKHIKQLLVS